MTARTIPSLSSFSHLFQYVFLIFQFFFHYLLYLFIFIYIERLGQTYTLERGEVDQQMRQKNKPLDLPTA